MLLDLMAAKLGWPRPTELLRPPGAGAAVYAEAVGSKIRQRLSRKLSTAVHLGVLTSDLSSDATEPPFALVCEFASPVSHEVLRELHRLAWNFSRSPLLITLEPQLIRAWTCWARPTSSDVEDYLVETLDPSVLRAPFSEVLGSALHWINLVTRQFLANQPGRFRHESRADQTLLANLRWVRDALRENGLSYELCHLLLARVIFVQFLAHRSDAVGRSALAPPVFEMLHRERVMAHAHQDLASILRSHSDSYALFRWLDKKFNGDLFPGKGKSRQEQESEWQGEQSRVESRHLALLADFITGNLRMDDGQASLWPLYSFDTIPLDFISTIYETFVRGEHAAPGTHFTPPHVADLILDAVLPWRSTDWNIKVFDPACGSGVFLVKAFQRLIYRWRFAHNGRAPGSDLLKRLLERNLFGTDMSSGAVSVASLSLYLAMCDEIDPKHYWQQVRFPQLKDSQIVTADFFSDDDSGPHSKRHRGAYDLVVGNAPWGEDTATEAARNWAAHNEWTIANNDVGCLFLAKAATLLKGGGRVSMIQNAGALLFNGTKPAKLFRSKLFTEYHVEGVTNLALLRRRLFDQSESPTCIITFRNERPGGEPIAYATPKSTNEDRSRIVIDPPDIQWVHPEEAASDPLVWTILMWGGRRDLALLGRLREMRTLEKLKRRREVIVRQGIVRGGLDYKAIVGRRILEEPTDPSGFFMRLDPAQLPINTNPSSHRATDLSAFETPQLVIRQTWLKATGRFQAWRTAAPPAQPGALCSQSYISVHARGESESWLDAACVVYNSHFAVYHAFLTSSRFAAYRPELRVGDLLGVPIPYITRGDALRHVRDYKEVDERASVLLGLKDVERVLIEDLLRFDLAEFTNRPSPARHPTTRSSADGEVEPDLTQYCQFFMKVLAAGFGEESLGATVFTEPKGQKLPTRVVAIHLEAPLNEIRYESIAIPAVWQQLALLGRERASGNAGPAAIPRVARFYDTWHHGERSIPTVVLIKPDAGRYWTRSAAIRDADEVSADILAWRPASI